MSTLKQYSEREFYKILRKNGFTKKRYNGGSHVIYMDCNNRIISFPINREPNKMLIYRIIKNNKLKV